MYKLYFDCFHLYNALYNSTNDDEDYDDIEKSLENAFFVHVLAKPPAENLFFKKSEKKAKDALFVLNIPIYCLILSYVLLLGYLSISFFLLSKGHLQSTKNEWN